MEQLRRDPAQLEQELADHHAAVDGLPRRVWTPIDARHVREIERLGARLAALRARVRGVLRPE